MPRSMIRLYKFVLDYKYTVDKVFIGYSNMLVWMDTHTDSMPIRLDIPHPMPKKVDDSNFRYLHEFGT